MSLLPQKITVFAIAIIGLITTPVTVTAFTIQEVTQSAIVTGNDNQVKQDVNQFLVLNNADYTEFIFQQYSEQTIFIEGANNQVIQRINQIQVKLFDSFVSPIFLPFTIDQFSFQDVLINGQNNQVVQQVNQAAIAVFESNTNLTNPSITEVAQETFYQTVKTSEFNQITQSITQTWLNIFVFGTDRWIDNLNLDEFIESTTQEKFNLAQSVPESTNMISLLALGTLGILVKIFQSVKA